MIHEIVQSILERGLPELTKAHTYSSENSDIYEAFDNGQNDYRVRTHQQLTKVLTEVFGEILNTKAIVDIIFKERLQNGDWTRESVAQAISDNITELLGGV